MGKIAFMFPGQGSQVVGMGKSFYDSFSSAKAVYDLASNVLERSISNLCFESSEEELKQTVNSQPAILTTSLAALAAFNEKSSIKPNFVLGHSLGEISAYCAAGVLNYENTFKIIQNRAKCMQQATTLCDGKMAAIIGADLAIIRQSLAKVGNKVSVANFNSPAQIVITGEAESLDFVCEDLKSAGVKRVIPLAVSGAFHSGLMKSAADEFAKFVDNIAFLDAKIPVVTNVDASLTVLSDDFKKKVVSQIYSSVLWSDSVQMLINEENVDTFIEFGQGKVLSGLVKKINSDVNVYNVSDVDTLNFVLENLGD